MKTYHYIAIFIRFFAIVLFVGLVNQIAYLYETYRVSNSQGINITTLTEGVTFVVLSFIIICLWFFPLSIAKKIVPLEASLEPEILSAQQLLSILISGLAIYFIYFSVNDAVFWYVFYKIGMASSDAYQVFSLSAENKANVVATMVEFVVSVGLLLGSKKIARFAMKF